jgi:serine/threonine protein kinase
MGAIYQAVDEHLGTSMAVKENLFLAPEYTRQFEREAAILASVKHPNLPRVGDYFNLEGQGQYLVMDYVEGEDLRERIERINTLSEDEAILIGIGICDALSYLHSRISPIVHRDIKPGNIKITPKGEIFLVDFGLAKMIQHTQQATSTGARAMTPGYSPPEQYGTARTDARSDIYSLGATLYAAITGTIPEDGLSRATGKEKLTPIRRLQPKISRELVEVIETALAVEPADRFQTAEEFKTALAEAGNIPLAKTITVNAPPHDDEQTIVDTYRSSAIVTPRKRGSFFRKTQTLRRTAAVLGIIAFFLVLIPGVNFIQTGQFFPLSLFEVAEQIATQTTSTNTIPTEKATLESTSAREIIEITEPTPESIVTPTLLPTQPVLSSNLGGGTGKIAFSSKRTNAFQIWTMNPDGSNQIQLTDMDGGACQPNWSPDGKMLAFISPCEEKALIYEDAVIYTMKADGSEISALPISNGGDFDPSWAPDGNRIAFTSLRSGISHVFLYSFETGTLEELSDSPNPDSQPAWNPSGKQIAVSRTIGFRHIWIMSDRGQTQLQFTPNGAYNETWPVWSPDGEDLIYNRSTADSAIPWLERMAYEDRNTARTQRIPNTGDIGPVSNARYSPDGQWIIYESWPDGNNHDIYLMDRNGRNVLRLTSDPEFDFGPVWQP